MNKKQRKLIADSGFDISRFYLTSDGWSYDGFSAWQLELSEEAKRICSDDTRISSLLRSLDDNL